MQSPQKVLIYRLGSLGDTAIMLPVFHHLMAHWPDAERRVLTNSPVSVEAPALQAVLGDGIFVDGYFTHPVGLSDPVELWRLAREIRSWGPDIVVYANEFRPLVSTVRDWAYLRLCGARRVYGLPLRPRYREYPVDPVSGLHEKEIGRITRALSAVGPIDIGDRETWRLRLGARERVQATDLVENWPGRQRFMCFSAGTKQAIKDWTDPNWITVFTKLSAVDPALGIAAVGAPQDRERTDALLAHWRGPVLNACGRADPRTSAALIEQAVFFLGNDSGPMHLAAAVQTPAVAVFSRHAKPGIWFPLGDDHRIFYPGLSWSGGVPLHHRDADGEETILDIPADQVVEACRGFIDRSSEAAE